jgi:glc operon protein GlcG
MRPSLSAAVAAAAALTVAWSSATAQIAAKHGLNLDGARRVIAAAEQEARSHNEGGVIAVVDEGGNLLALERIDNTFAAGSKISIGKARTAALFKRPTKFFEDIIKNGRTSMVALEDFTPLQGGIPIVVGGEIVGAVGVSGAASAQRDEEVAMAGARALADDSTLAAGTVMQSGMPDSAPDVRYWSPDAVAAALAKGTVLLDGANGTRNYMVHASHRDKRGLAEVHTLDADLVYVVRGTATIVTGGTVVAPKAIEPFEIRGSAIEGGTSQKLAPGAVLVVPRGTPHWFRDVDGAFDYFVVKVR